jgi:subtilisin family serine protease
MGDSFFNQGRSVQIARLATGMVCVAIVGTMAFAADARDSQRGPQEAIQFPSHVNHVGKTTYAYHYFKEPRELLLDTGRIAVFDEFMRDDALLEVGLDPSEVENHAIAGLRYVYLPAERQNAAAIEELVEAISKTDLVQWVSPVFLDERDEPVLMGRHLHVQFDSNVTPRTAEAMLAGFFNGRIEQVNWADMPNTYRLESFSANGLKVLESANMLAQMPDVIFAEPDMLMRVRKSLIPNDPFFSSLWGLRNFGQSGGTSDMDMDANEAWDTTTGDPSIVVVIFDDGVQQNHPDITQRSGADFTTSGTGTGGDPGNFCDNHGTAVAGCVSATINNGIGVVGVAPNCEVASARVSVSDVPCNGFGSFFTSWQVDALTWAQNIGARVTNNSAGFGSSSSITSKYSQTRNAGLVHFASSGNSGTTGIDYPASLGSVMAIGAINRNGNRASFSTYGSGLSLVAPGQSILTTDRTGSSGYENDDYSFVDGTSFSSPYAAGVAALVLSVEDSLTAPQVEDILESTAKDRGASGYDTEYGWGIVQAQAAVEEIATVCGDGVCSPGEDCDSCPGDCGLCDYCMAGATNEDFEYITTMSFGTLNNISTFQTGGYSDFTGMTAFVFGGNQYTLSFTFANGQVSDIGGVWIDWDQDGTFNDAGEEITTSLSGAGPFSVDIDIPDTLPPAFTTRMRVRVQNSVFDATLDPCDDTTRGEVEDYTISIIEAPGACCMPNGDCVLMLEAACDSSGGAFNGSGTSCGAISCPQPCPADIIPYDPDNGIIGDGVVNTDDFFRLLQNWGPCDPEDESCRGDIEPYNEVDGTYGDGVVGTADFFALLQAWGTCD